ncbi:mechanosensitive ion channel domain-containing protein [Rhodopirellula sallentina]|uniref:MscS Mechanosensitive ion channel n=1 Tax=Rhodopirellula sallentina SM41 TaxID=1263870 RepID=M5U7P7_9BACT|nr:mechanosensitive ion channel domain-containing protein [Rhodopirellula sallentina]EMI51978.1 MscS Mechanosensitive ion channel [Rhodopirellula sallentina SM41]
MTSPHHRSSFYRIAFGQTAFVNALLVHGATATRVGALVLAFIATPLLAQQTVYLDEGYSQTSHHATLVAPPPISTQQAIMNAPPIESRPDLIASSRRYPATSYFESSLDDSRGSINRAPRYGSNGMETASEVASRFRRLSETAPEPVANVAAQNASYVEQWIELNALQRELSTRVDEANAKLDRTTTDLNDITAKLHHYGLTPTIGMLLRSRREQLDQWQVDDSSNLFAGQELARSRAQQLEIEMVRHDGSHPELHARELLDAAGIASATSDYPRLNYQLQDLLEERHQWLASLKQGYQDYQQKLGELDSTTAAAASLADRYRALIDRHITWIRSGNPLSIGDLKRLGQGASALFDSSRSAAFGYSVQRKWESSPIEGIGLIASVVIVLLLRWRAKVVLVGVGERRRMKDASPEMRKVVASVLTVLVAFAIPGALYLIARWLGNGYVSESTLTASSGIYAASLVALMVELPRQLLRGSGFVDKHVDVELPRRERASTYLKVIGLGLVLAAYVVTLVGEVDHGAWRDSTARLGFLLSMALVAWTFHLALRPVGGFLEPLIAKFGGSVIHRLRFVIYFAGIGFPLVMMVLSSLGYSFTACELIQKAIFTLSGLLVAATLWPAVKILSSHCWGMLTGTAPTKPERDRYGELPDTSGSSVTGVLGEHYLELKHHLAFLCQCALVFTAIVGIGWLWIDIFPNVRMGNPVVWSVEDTVTKTTMDASGQMVASTVVETTPVTVVHLLAAAVTLFVAFQLAKLLPALFDALVLQRVSFDEAMEHFSLVLGRFLLFGVGCLIACKWIGIRWQTIQWLAVGLTIGLGFGLQDMVRNLFGGLIVLFEKPARLGDFITVGNVKGRVAAQRLRTTVLSDDDGREVIIPNQNFVDSEVVNWRGAGRLSAVPLEVAVSRDERPADICRTLTELVIEQDEVLLTPTPQATLVCVGKRSQRIEVRAWIEEGRDAESYRDSLLRIVRRYLSERNLLAKSQPTQPPMLDQFDALTSDSRSTRSKRRRVA